MCIGTPIITLESTMNPGTSANGTTVLTSWKDIARYMGKGVRTVQRWEQDFGLPVRRPQGSNKKAVLARPRDLDAWVALRCSSRPHNAIELSVSSPRERPAAADGRREHLTALCSLNAQIETSRILRTSNKLLVDEVHAALNTLKENLLLLQIGH